MGVDVFKSYHTELGILDTNMYDHDLVYGVSPGEYMHTTHPFFFPSLLFMRTACGRALDTA